jgi:hypothetical protein
VADTGYGAEIDPLTIGVKMFPDEAENENVRKVSMINAKNG